MDSPGLLRVKRMAWQPQKTGSVFYDATERTTGEIKVEKDMVVRRLPGAGERTETWRVLEWTFDPFSLPVAVDTSVPSTAAGSFSVAGVQDTTEVTNNNARRSRSSSSHTHVRSQRSSDEDGGALDAPLSLGGDFRLTSRSPSPAYLGDAGSNDGVKDAAGATAEGSAGEPGLAAEAREERGESPAEKAKRKKRKKKEGKEKKAKKSKKAEKEASDDGKAPSPAAVVPAVVPAAAPKRAASPKRQASPPSPPVRRMELSPSPQEKSAPLAKEKKKAKKQKNEGEKSEERQRRR